ncbi:MAG: ABC transporter permease [Actinomycetota bacterium]|nr:ABC transporter permease [Actinomycetota bacterium]
MTQLSYYDSAQTRRPVVSELRNFWDYRGLIKLLIVRDLTVRYKRSALGVWWTLLNPLLTSAVLWIIFSNFFRFQVDEAPYVVFLLSGILLATSFAQGVSAAGSAIVNSAGVLSKVHVPAEVFSFASALASGVNLLITVIPLLIIQAFHPEAIVPWTVILIVIPTLALVMLVAGLGLLIASAAVYFYDVLDLSNVLIQLVTYLIPTFYPLTIVPDQFQVFIRANPLLSYLRVFRGFVFEGTFAAPVEFVVMGVTSVTVLTLGVWVFSRSWKNLVVLL